MSTQSFKILFLCTGNSARSILGEYLIRRIAPGRFESFSAGAKPAGKINPLVLRVLRETYKIDASTAWSKSWEEYKDVHFDFVITVCDNAKESCPVFPGSTAVIHQSFEDPAAVQGSDEEKLAVFRSVRDQLRTFSAEFPNRSRG